MDNLRLGVDWDVNEPELKAAMAAAKKDINGVGQTVEEVEKKVKKSISSMASSAANTEGILESLKRRLSELYEQANKATTFAGLHSLNAEIEAYESKLAQLTRAGKGGFELQGQAMIQQEGILQRLQRAAALYQKGMLEATREDNLEKYSQKLALVNAQIAALTKGQAVGGGFNGLQNSINQISRELPAFTYSVQTGFMAISNNIPILVDELSKARVQNQALVASGQKGIPVWKQLVSSLFSWQTAMSLGITLLTVYGKEIGAFIKSLFGGKDAIDASKESLNALNSALSDNNFKKAATGVIELRTNIDLAKKGLLSKTDVVKQYNSELGKTMGEVKTLNEVEAKMIQKADAYVKMMLYKAAATSALAEAGKAAMNAMVEINKTDEQSIDYVSSGLANSDDPKAQELYRRNAERNRQKAAKQFTDQQKTFEQIAKDFQTRAAETAKANGLNFFPDTKSGKKATDSIIKQRQSLLDKIAEIDAEYARKSFTKDEEELQALRDKFKKIRTEVERFNANPKNKNVRIELQGLAETQARAEEDLIYRQQTEKLKKQLDDQKHVFDEYEKYKNQFGKQAADERFKNEKKGFDTYTEYLNAKAKENAGAIAAAMTGTATGGQSERVKLLLKEGADENKAQEELWNEQLAELLSYEKGRAKIIEDYNVLRKKLVEQGRNEEAYVLDENFKNELKEYDDTNIQKLDSYKDLFNGIERLTDVGARRVIANAKAMLQALLAAGKISPELAKEINDRLADTQQALDDRLPNRLNDLAQGLGQIADLAGAIDSGFGGVLGTVTSIVTASAQVFGNIKGLKDGLLNFRQNSADGGGGILGTISAIAGVAGPAGQIVGAVSGVVKGVVGFFKARKEAAEAARKAVSDYYSAIAAGEREYEKLLRQRELTAVSQGKTSYKAIIDQLELLKKQAPEIEAAYNRIYAALQGQEFVSGIGYKHGTWLRKAKTWDIMSSLAGADYDRLEKLYTQGALKDQAKADFEALKSLREELESTGLDVADLQRQLNEMLTGTSATGLADSLTQLFQNGKLAASDLGKSFEEIMKNAISNTFKYKYLEEQMSPFYDAISKLMSSGTPTEEQINQLREQYKKLGEEAAKQWQNLEDVTGIDLESKTDNNSSVGKIQQALTEQTGSEMIGLQRASYDLDKKQLNAIEQALSVSKQIYASILQGIRHWAAIEKNTAEGVTELKNAVTELKAINKNTAGGGYDKGF